MKRAKYISILLSILLFFCIEGQRKGFAQDIHFSQFTLTPVNINPALTGFFSGDHRAILNYKNQWNGMAASGAAYNTYMCSYDTRLLTQKIKNGYLGAGFNAFRDVAGDLNLGTTQLNVSLSGVVSINEKQAVSGGIQSGIIQKSISTSAMQWDSQYNSDQGQFDPTLPSNDVSTIPPKTVGDVSAGLAWNYNANKASTASNYSVTNKQLKFNLGVSAFHLNKPNQKFNIYNADVTDLLHSKFIIHGNAHIGFGASGYQLLPSFIYFKQGPFTEFDIGTMVRWVITPESKYTGYVQGMAISVGAQYRSGDAIIPMVLYEYSDFALGLSYDVNTSALVKGTRGRGGLEIALRYIRPIKVSSTRLLD